MMLHTSSTTRSLGLGSWAAAAHTVSVQTIAAAGRSSGSSSRRSNTVTSASRGQKVVPLVGEEMAEAAGCEGTQQLRQVAVPVAFEIGVEVLESGALPGLGVVARQGVVQGGPPRSAEALPHHHLDEPSQAADALEKLLGVSPLDHERVHALSGDAWGQHPAACGAGHVRVLALRVDDVGGHALWSDP